ncbi:MAG: DUF2480 family protein [Candidatus Marinimicrobia bacterium]|nr:DUF2480 family protein [Candidatus Neomarinimicrobiota bacterium]
MALETIHLNDFLDGGILREKSFRKQVTELDWSQYTEKKVIIKGCADIPIPTWAYLIITAQLSQFAKKIYYGEPRYAVEIFSQKKS